ncbi:hypothetical protein AN958_01044 [Leucoagaricus sp. SymC.cos]|nr:hypothetical protein AN958_01044 [Leucoagaricus sp. SymC.cos]
MHHITTTTWSDLPNGIIIQVLSYCDTPTLLSLSHLNTHINKLSLTLLFKREHIVPNYGYTSSYLAPPEILHALNSALWLTHLPKIHFYLNGDKKRLLYEVKGLERLIGRVDSNESLFLSFGNVDRWFWSVEPWEMRDELIEPVIWRSIFVRLLETALRKGCKSLHVEGGHKLEMYYVGGPSKLIVSSGKDLVVASPLLLGTASTATLLPGSSKPSIKKRLARSITKRLGSQVLGLRSSNTQDKVSATSSASVIVEGVPMPTPTCDTELTSFQTSTSCLTTLNIRSSLMFQHLFFSSTVALIRAHSSTIETLELVSIKAPLTTWTILFKFIHLPVLEKFVYCEDILIVDETVITPTLLLDFFMRHSSLKVVELYGVRVGDRESDEKTVFPSVEEARLRISNFRMSRFRLFLPPN